MSREGNLLISDPCAIFDQMYTADMKYVARLEFVSSSERPMSWTEMDKWFDRRQTSGQDEAETADSSDLIQLQAVTWPATNSEGQLVAPPDDHVFYELIHAHQLLSADILTSTPRIGNLSIIPQLPTCGFCTENAQYDAFVEIKFAIGRAYLCELHYLRWGSRTLGTDHDIYLMLETEVPTRVQTACNRLLRRQGRGSIF